MKEITLDFLRNEIKETEKVYDSLVNKKISEVCEEDLNMLKYWIGQICTYERLIQYMKGLNEREFQIQKKKGIL